MSIKQVNAITLALMSTALFACGPAGNKGETTSAQQQSSGDPTPMQYYEAYMGKAGMAIAEGRTEDALNAYLAAAEILDETGEDTVKRAEAHFLAADQAYQRLEKMLAIEEYQKSVDIYLRFTGNSRAKAIVALTNMGAIWKEEAKREKAHNCWEQALQIYKALPPENQNKSHMHRIKQNIRDLEYGF